MNPQSRKEDMKHTLWLVIGVIVYFLAMFLLSGCATQRNAEKYYKKNPGELAIVCAEKFPATETVTVKDSLRIDTVVFVDEVVRVDTLTIDGQTVYLSRPCPPSKTITRTEYKERTVTVKDSAGNAAFRYQIAEQGKEIAVLSADKSRLQEGRNVWRRYALITWGIILLLIALYILSRRLKLPVKL